MSKLTTLVHQARVGEVNSGVNPSWQLQLTWPVAGGAQQVSAVMISLPFRHRHGKYIYKMADDIDASSVSSNILCNNAVHRSGTSCLSCKNLKEELQRVQDDLKTAQFIIELLRKELSSTSEQESSGKYIHSKECDECDNDEWRQVRVSQATKKRDNIPPITDYCVHTANRYVVLHDLQEHRQPNLQPPTKYKGRPIATVINGVPSMRNRKKSEQKHKNQQSNNTGNMVKSKKHSVLLLGDSHAKRSADLIKNELSKEFGVIGIVKPGARTSDILNTNIDKSMTNNDIVIVWAGTNDISKDRAKEGINNVINFIERTSHTNILIMEVPHRHDLADWSCVNREVIRFNRLLAKRLKSYQHAAICRMDLGRQHFTKHGLHMNKEGKVKMCQQLAKLVKLKVGERVNRATPLECRAHVEVIPLNYEGNTVQTNTTKIQLNETEEGTAETHVIATEDETVEIGGTVTEDEVTQIQVTEAENETAEIQVNEDKETPVDPTLSRVVSSSGDQQQEIRMSTRKRNLPVKLSKDFL
jgi:hypothetical protein